MQNDDVIWHPYFLKVSRKHRININLIYFKKVISSVWQVTVSMAGSGFYMTGIGRRQRRILVDDSSDD